MDLATFESIKAYVGFDDESAAVLQQSHAVLAPYFEPIVDDFYEAIEAHPRASGVITGGRAQIDRLKRTLVSWVGSVLLGPHDQAYLDAHSRIGRVHVRIALPQEFMFTAMDRIRVRLLDVLRSELEGDPERVARAARAIHQILDLELAIMLDTYREDLMQKVRATERLATIGQLAASIGHELRNPLGIIESSLFLIERRMQKEQLSDPYLQKHHQKIVDQVKHCGKTINSLLDLARDRPPKRRRVELLPLLDKALDHSNTKTRLALELDVPAGLLIDVDPDDMVHVLANLLLNAADAQHGGPGPARAWISARAVTGGAEIYIEDAGPGVPSDIRHKIFDALFTTKSRGTGLGLALCRRIVYAHGGELQLEDSSRQHGARFRIWLPELQDLANVSSHG